MVVVFFGCYLGNTWHH